MSKTYIPKALRERVEEQAQHRCGYCLSQEEVIGAPMEIDHLLPEALGGLTEEENYGSRARSATATKVIYLLHWTLRQVSSCGCLTLVCSGGLSTLRGRPRATKSSDYPRLDVQRSVR